MKLSTGLNFLGARDTKKRISKKITHANTGDKRLDSKTLNKASGTSSDPLFFTNGISDSQLWNPDIRYRQNYVISPLVAIGYRNDLFVFAENNEVKKAVGTVADEATIMDAEVNRYPVYPVINQVMVGEDKQKTAEAIQDYLDNVFYPKLYQWYDFKDDGLVNLVREFLITGKVCYEIIYDSLNSPKDIIGLQPLDPSTLQKFKQNGLVYYIQRSVDGAMGGTKDRILHENQVICIEWNEYDFGYISYVDKLRRSFNIMRSMQTSKVLWFAAKSQVRMHIKLAMGDVSRPEAIQKLTETKNQYINQFSFTDDGVVRFNNEPNNSGYREFFTAETSGSGSPEIEEINANGPDLSETDSLSFWSKLYWNDTEIPYDRIDPNATEGWGFTDVNALRSQEKNFGKFINRIRKMLNALFIKPIIIQLTLKEVEIGIDLNLLDSIKIEWIAFNQYDKLAELELFNKKVELASNISQFGEYTDANDKTRKAIPISWIIKTFLDLTPEQLDAMERERIKENLILGFNADGSLPDEMTDESMSNEDEMTDEEPVPEIIELIKSGEIPKEDIPTLIDSGELTDADIEALKSEGLYEEESAEQIADADDSNW